MSKQENGVNCGNQDCKVCHPQPDDGIPRLHGWITPQYAKEIIKELQDFVDKNADL